MFCYVLAQDVIDWQAAHGCFSDLDRRGFLSLLPAHARNSMPDRGDCVLYYGDGHVLSVQAEVIERYMTKMARKYSAV